MTNEKEKQFAERIKNTYTVKSTEQTKLDELKSLDKKVKCPVLVFAYVYGTIGTLILGLGMCLAMKIIGNIMILGIVIGLVGIAIVSSTYPIYQMILRNRKSNYAEEIIKKSNEILNN